MGDQIDSILYLPTGSEWQHEKCRLLGFSFIRSNYIKSKDSVRIGISQAPLATVRKKVDGNCLFRSLSQVLTGSQDKHKEVRLLVTSYMVHNCTILNLHVYWTQMKQWNNTSSE